MSNRADIRFYCVSHQCLVYEGRPLTDREMVAVRKAHTIMHRVLTVPNIQSCWEK